MCRYQARRYHRTILLAGLAALIPSALADEAGDPVDLTTITITAPGLSRDLLRTPAAVAVVDARDLRQGRQGLQLDESLNRIPGVLFQNRYNFAQNLRIS